MEENKDNQILCYLLELSYIEANGKTSKDGYNSDLFPMNYTSLDYEIRIEIIKEALDNHIKIIDTNLYAQNCEGVRNGK